MKSLFNWNEKNRRNRERALRLESLEDRMLLAVTAGGETAAAVLAADADPMATAAVKLDAPENIQGVSSANSRITLSWDAVSGASGYTVNYRQVGSTDWKTKDVTTASTTITGVLYTKAYEYKVMAKGNGSSYTDSDFSETVKFLANPKYSTVVTTLDDAAVSTSPTQITLRQAVYFASQTDGTVTFADGLEGTIDLAANGQIGLKEIFGGFTIDGDNRITVTNSAEGKGRLFYALASDSVAFNKTITFQNITLDGGDATGYDNDPYFTDGEGNAFGSAIMVFCGYNPTKTLSVVLDNVTVSNNEGGKGAVYVFGAGDVLVNNSTFTGNFSGSAGGLFVQGSAFLSIADSTFTENIASSSGGAIVISETDAAIDNTYIINNKVYAPKDGAYLDGGGLCVSGADYNNICSVVLNNSFIENNYIGVDPESEVTYARYVTGGGASLHNCNFTTNNCTISGNYATDAWEAAGGAIYYSNVDSYGYEKLTEQGHGTVRLNQTYLQNNVAGTFHQYVGAINQAKGGALFVNDNLVLFGSVVTGNEIRGNLSLVANAIYTFNNLNGASNFFCYYTTIAGNKTYSIAGGGMSDESGAIREFGNSYYWGSVLIGNLKIDMKGTVEDASDDEVSELNFYTFALEENGCQLPRILSCVVNKDAMTSVDFDNPKWHYGLDLYTYGTYYDDAAYTQVSAGQYKDAGKYLRDDNVNVTDYQSFFKDYMGGDYTLAKNSPAVDAFNMDIYGDGLGYEYDIRGEGYYRVVNEIVDIGAYEYQLSKPTFEVTVNGWTGKYDGQPHTVTIDGLAAGDTVYYSANGITYGTDVISYTEVGEYTIFVKVERAGYEDFYGSGDVVIQGSSQKLDAPVISTGKPGVYVSYGANRHQITWGAVANASGYELAYNAGDTWKTMTVTGTSAVVTGLAYESDVQYKVRALGTGSYTDSDYSAVKTFTVCPMDINNDGDIAGADRTLLGNAWLAEEGDENYLPCCDIDGNEEVSGTDRSFLVKNWLCEVGEDELAYPKPLNAGDAAIAEFVSEFDIDLDVF